MEELGLPYVDYITFYARVGRLKWDLYRSIHTPAKTCTKRNSKEGRIKKFFKSLFNKNGLRKQK